MTASWEDVVDEYALQLPLVEESTSYDTPSLKVAGKLMCRLRTAAQAPHQSPAERLTA